jgi:hypothetical protein
MGVEQPRVLPGQDLGGDLSAGVIDLRDSVAVSVGLPQAVLRLSPRVVRDFSCGWAGRQRLDWYFRLRAAKKKRAGGGEGSAVFAPIIVQIIDFSRAFRDTDHADCSTIEIANFTRKLTMN